jgi:hypothetical protein
MILDDLAYCGHPQAREISIRVIEDFIDDFGFNAFADTADLLMQNEISFEMFESGLFNPDYAKDTFGLKKITYRGEYHA